MLVVSAGCEPLPRTRPRAAAPGQAPVIGSAAPVPDTVVLGGVVTS
ncbi:hypothetical protein [Streptomyces sp. HUAS ZL42]